MKIISSQCESITQWESIEPPIAERTDKGWHKRVSYRLSGGDPVLAICRALASYLLRNTLAVIVPLRKPSVKCTTILSPVATPNRLYAMQSAFPIYRGSACEWPSRWLSLYTYAIFVAFQTQADEKTLPQESEILIHIAYWVSYRWP